MSAITPQKRYEPKDSITLGFSAAGMSAIVGTVVSAAQNSLGKHNFGAMGIFTRSGATIALFATAGGLYAFGEAASSNLRETNDAWNQFYGGALAGATVGVYKRTIPAVVGYSAGVAVLMGLFGWSGGHIGGIYAHMDKKEKAEWEKTFFANERRLPRSEVLEKLSAAPK
ncbi:hypothetical protein BCR37DRAFT_381374 [Protomyces lactucae-debilis]|uniref:Uncharacterized protein n=1 Tax=Protomyces lactucae-debilis TaxID=2754530 RepID=A0A1Y2F943_PROLT|nr:uncharacterized protein BCR37DRAFT_381374 [Protomyces lactucae-debilis]ORY79954.1 hypothetical protein BCR37DRAFT_381374 [Protomyces lactucae-debilis]